MRGIRHSMLFGRYFWCGLEAPKNILPYCTQHGLVCMYVCLYVMLCYVRLCYFMLCMYVYEEDFTGIWPFRTVAFFWVSSLLSPNKFNESETGLRMGPKMGTGSPPENNWCGVISTGSPEPQRFFFHKQIGKNMKKNINSWINSGKWENIGFSMVFPH